MKEGLITDPEAVSKATANAVACSDLLSAAEQALRQWEYFSNELRSLYDHPPLGQAKNDMEDISFLRCKEIIKSAALNGALSSGGLARP